MQALDYLAVSIKGEISTDDLINQCYEIGSILELVNIGQYVIVRFADGDSLIFNIFGKATLITTDNPYPDLGEIVNVIYL